MPSVLNEPGRRVTKLPHGGAVADQREQLPCPRCESTNTKFCYYNNYNFSQPRHFCKSCRRYWTHGGTLRDIPVGGVSRKSSKRSGTFSSAAASNAVGRSYPLQATPVLFPPSSDIGGCTAAKGSASSLYGGFTSLLGGGFNGPEGFGLGLGQRLYLDDVRFRQGMFSTDSYSSCHVASMPITWLQCPSRGVWKLLRLMR